MKALYRKVPVKLERSFNIRRDVKPHFIGEGHYHPELELHYVIKGEGIRSIGDVRSTFSAGELVLVGANLPHAWRSSEDYYINSNCDIEVIVVNFAPEFLGQQFFHLPETINIKKLIERSRIGLEFFGTTRERVGGLLLSLSEAEGFDRVILFLEILHLLAGTNDCRSIANGRNMLFQRNQTDARRINLICDYTLDHFTREISLEEISSICNLSVSSFCRYFKMMTAKTYMEFLIETRVSQACKLLLEETLPIEMVCANCGFQNISNFYRHFRKVMGMTPQGYRRKFLLEPAKYLSKKRHIS